MVDPNSFPYRTDQRILAIGQHHLRPRPLARRFVSRPRKNRQSFNLFFGHRQFDCSPPSCHDPLLVWPIAKQGIRHPIICSTTQVSWNRSSRTIEARKRSQDLLCLEQLQPGRKPPLACCDLVVGHRFSPLVGAALSQHTTSLSACRTRRGGG